MISRIFAAAAVGLSVPVGRAVEPWLIPERFAVTPGATLQLDLSEIDIGPAQRHAGFSVGSERVSYAFSRLGDENLEIRSFELSDGGIRFSAQMKRPGVASVVIGLQPIITEMGFEVLEENLRSLHLSERAKQELIAKIGKRRWRAIIRLHTKVFVRVGLPLETEREWEKAVGGDLELIPSLNPTDLRVGMVVPVRVLFKGAAAPNVAVNFKTFDGAHQHVAYTDADGRTEVILGVAGKWLIFGTVMQSSGGAGELDLDMDTTTLTVEVR